MRLFDRSGSQVLTGGNSITLHRQAGTSAWKEGASSALDNASRSVNILSETAPFLDLLTVLYQRPYCK